MTPKERAAQRKMIKSLDDCVAVAVSPGNADVNSYMHGYANGLILAQSIVKDTTPEFLKAPETYIAERPRPGLAATAVDNGAPDIAKEASALVGLWISRQIAAGQTAIDADRLRYVREGIEIALS